MLLLEHTGLRITIHYTFRKDKIADGKLLIYTAKTGEPVWIPLHTEVLRELEALPFRPFWSGNGLPKSAVANWQRTLARLFKLAGIRDMRTGIATPSRSGFYSRISIEDVAVLLGHGDIKSPAALRALGESAAGPAGRSGETDVCLGFFNRGGENPWTKIFVLACTPISSQL